MSAPLFRKGDRVRLSPLGLALLARKKPRSHRALTAAQTGVVALDQTEYQRWSGGLHVVRGGNKCASHVRAAQWELDPNYVAQAAPPHAVHGVYKNPERPSCAAKSA